MKYLKGVEVVVSVIVENPKGEILLTKSPKWSNKWTLPGGHVEPGEKIEEALLREAKEETGLSVKFVKIISFGELISSKDFHRDAHFIYFDVLGKTNDTKVKLDNNELSEFKWIDPNKALKMNLAESFDDTIKEYINYKKSNSS
ncbi:MAG: NUDIX domain-containing protein [Candidatus Woesearchaeota archaeon]